MIREAEILDIDELSRLAVKLWTNNNTAESLKGEFKEILKNENAVIMLCIENNSVIAFAQCQLRHDYVEGIKTSPVGYLEGIFVEESYRSKGIARQLIGKCEIWAKEKGCSEFASDCEITNLDSLKFHLSAGFTEVNRIICFKKELL